MDNQQFSLSRDIIRSLKCVFCDCYLSVPPIVVTSLRGNEWKCGRCSFIATEYNIPALLFETVAMSLRFPCTHANCPAEMPWEDIKQHEETCNFQPIRCPCGQNEEMYLALHHFRQEHLDIVSNNKAVVENPAFSELVTRLILFNNVPFLVYIYCERNAETKVGVFSLEKTQSVYEVQLKFTTDHNSCNITMPSKKIHKYRLREHCPDCLLKVCNVKYHKYYQSNQDVLNYDVYKMMNVRVNTLSVLNVLNSDTFTMTVSVLERRNQQPIADSVLVRNERVRKSWECQICQEYLDGAIYICLTGHSLCSRCRARLNNCPYCDTRLGNSRNFALEEMAEFAEIVCQYENNGCDYVGNIKRVAKHELKCPWNRTGDGPSAKKKLKITA